jgi:hypothetical protein
MNRRRPHFESFLIAATLLFASDSVSGEHTPQFRLHNTSSSIYLSNTTNLPGMTTLVPNTTGHVDPSVSNGHVYRPPQVPLDVGLYPTAPEGLKLAQVHVFVRHGALIMIIYTDGTLYKTSLQVNARQSVSDSLVPPLLSRCIG